jgi:hypothetical protein
MKIANAISNDFFYILLIWDGKTMIKKNKENNNK